MDGTAYVKIQDMSFYRRDRALFDRVNITIPTGKITAIMGPSGAGKTTLLRLIGGQLAPQQGQILVNGKNVHRLSQRNLYRLRRDMSVLFQSGALFTNLSVFDNIAFPLREHTNLSAQMIHDLVLIKLEAVGLRGAAELMPAALSGGMSRRIALARSLALDPSLVMYDEPFSGQDPITLGVLLKLIKELNNALAHTSIIVSHDVNEVFGIADYVYVISGGRVIGEGKPKELLASQQADLRQFLHGLPGGAVPFHYPGKSITEELMC